MWAQFRRPRGRDGEDRSQVLTSFYGAIRRFRENMGGVGPDKNIAISRETTPRLGELCKHEHCSGRMGPDTQGSIVQLRDGTILMYDHEPEADGDGRFVGRMWTSTDDWKTVKGPEETYVAVPQAVQTMVADNDALVVGMLFWGSVIELPSGSLLATMTGLFKEDKTPLKYNEKSTVAPKNMIQDRSILVRSEDRGRSWNYLSTIAAPPRGTQEGFNDQCDSLTKANQGKAYRSDSNGTRGSSVSSVF
jgi:hypothetical protein